jgi:D-sedoheptulose 7-phosphate isomerase
MSTDRTAFLYPFIESEERDAGPLLVALARSAGEKAAERARLRDETLAALAAELDVIAAEVARRFVAGGRAFTFGNGGSATDAAGFAALLVSPPSGRALRARSLVGDQATLTALGNDVGFDLVFSRQLMAHARAGDIAFGFSTSGNSDNLVKAFGEARRRGLFSVGFAGYDGGRMASSGDLDHCIVIRSDSVHRIQEAQDAVTLELWERTQRLLPACGAA